MTFCPSSPRSRSLAFAPFSLYSQRILWLFILLALAAGAWTPSSAHRLKGSDHAWDGLIAERGPEAFSQGTHRYTRVDDQGLLQLVISDQNTTSALRSAAAPSAAQASAGEKGAKAWTGEFRSEPKDFPFPVKEILPAWNVEFDPRTEGFAVEMRLRWLKSSNPKEKSQAAAPASAQAQSVAQLDQGAWSDWYHLGADGVDDPTSALLHRKDSNGFVDDDYIVTKIWADAWQWRIRFWRVGKGGGGGAKENSKAAPSAPRLRMLTLAISDPQPEGSAVPGAPAAATTAKESASASAASSSSLARSSLAPGTILDPFPWRSQMIGVKMENSICCPTSVGMVRNFFGDDRDTTQTAERCYDRGVEFFGCWPRAAQVLFEARVSPRALSPFFKDKTIPAQEAKLDSWIERFRRLEQAAPYLRQGIPIIISIKVKRGDISSLPDYDTNGHVVVLCGLDAEGGATLADPGTSHPERAFRKLKRQELETIWIANGGVGILAAPRSLAMPRPYGLRRASQP